MFCGPSIWIPLTEADWDSREDRQYMGCVSGLDATGVWVSCVSGPISQCLSPSGIDVCDAPAETGQFQDAFCCETPKSPPPPAPRGSPFLPGQSDLVIEISFTVGKERERVPRTFFGAIYRREFQHSRAPLFPSLSDQHFVWTIGEVRRGGGEEINFVVRLNCF